MFHARRFTLPSRHGEPTRELEIDFLVLAPDRGLLGIGVKGGAVGRDANGWYSVAHDKTPHRIKDPGHQVQHTTHVIADYLRHHPRFAGKVQPAFGWPVCFPNGHAPRNLGPDLPRAVVLDGADPNSRSSDLIILLQRAMVNRLTQPAFCRRPAKPWEGTDYFARGSEAHIDLMEDFGGWGKATPSLHEFATACRIPGKIATDGSQVTDLWLGGDVRSIVQDTVRRAVDLPALAASRTAVRAPEHGGPRQRGGTA